VLLVLKRDDQGEILVGVAEHAGEVAVVAQRYICLRMAAEHPVSSCPTCRMGNPRACGVAIAIQASKDYRANRTAYVAVLA
jgi:hypothetical protein